MKNQKSELFLISALTPVFSFALAAPLAAQDKGDDVKADFNQATYTVNGLSVGLTRWSMFYEIRPF